MTDHTDCWPPTEEEQAEAREALKEVLTEIEAHDLDYAARYRLVLGAMALAPIGGLEAGFRIDPNEPDWPVAYIELPTGQVSWHMPAHKQEWDGHTTEEKYARTRAYAAEPTPGGTT